MGAGENHPLLKPHAGITLAISAVGLAGSAFIPVGGLLIGVGIFLNAVACAGIAWLYWSDVREWFGGWGYPRRLNFPLFVVVLLAGIMVAALNKDAIINFAKPRPRAIASTGVAPPAHTVPPSPPKVVTAPAPPAPLPTSTPAQPESGQRSHIVVTGFQFGQVTDPKSSADKFANVTLANRGTIAGDNPVRTYQLAVEDSYLSDNSINDRMAKLLRMAEATPPKKVTDQIDVGEQPFFTLKNGISKDDWDAILAGRKRVYLLMLLTYRDAGTGKSAYWVSEYCASQSGGESIFEVCPVHNRVWLHH